MLEAHAPKFGIEYGKGKVRSWARNMQSPCAGYRRLQALAQ